MVVDWRWAREGWLSSWGRQSEWRANSRPIHSPLLLLNPLSPSSLAQLRVPTTSSSPFSSQFTLLANSLPSPAKARHLLSLTHFNLHPSLLSFTCVCSKSINSLALPVNTPFLLSILNTEMQSQPICFLEPPPQSTWCPAPPSPSSLPPLKRKPSHFVKEWGESGAW